MTEITYKNLKFNIDFKEYHPPLPLSFWCSDLYLENYQKLTGTDVGFIYYIIDSEFVGYMEQGGSERILKSLRDKISKSWIDDHLNNFQKHFSALKFLVEKARLKKYCREELIALFESLYHELSFLYPYSNAFYVLSPEIEGIILEKLRNKYSEKEASQIFSKLSQPIKPTFLAQFSIDAKKVAAEIKSRHGSLNSQGIKEIYDKDIVVKKKIDELRDKYFCLTSLNAGERTVDSFFADIAEKMSLKDEENDISIPKEIEQEIYLLKAMLYFKDELSTFTVPYVKYGLQIQWKEAERILGLKLDDIDQLFIGEVISNLKSHKNLDLLIKGRKKATFCFHKPFDNTLVTEGKDGETEINLIKQQEITADISDVKEITGKVGCAGKVIGKVQKIMKSTDLSSFKEGSILVSVYTGPEFVPAMKKAIAIVTDTGGITCHAAIVSRELAKPCVVGTKTSTRVLNNGDLIEVDANKGIVRILKKQ